MIGQFKRPHWKRRKPGELTKNEQAWLEHVGKTRPKDQIFFEPIKLRLADRTYFTPDFICLTEEGIIEAHEVKGSWKAPNQEDSRVKLKIAAEQFWWIRFVSIESKPIAKKHGGGWKFTVNVLE